MNNSTFYCLTIHYNVARTLAPMLIVEFVLGLLGNGIALWIFCFRVKFWKPSMIYLLNLVIADFLLMISLPFRIDNYIRGEHWIFGSTVCRINLFTLAMNKTVSITFLTVVAIDRYFKVVHPHHKVNTISLRGAIKIACGIWILVGLLNYYPLSSNLVKKYKNNSLCRSYSPYNKLSFIIIWHYGVFFLEFVFPFCIIMFCTISIIMKLKQRKLDRNKSRIRRTVNILIVIVVVFTVCFLPTTAAGVIAMMIKKLNPDVCYSFVIAGEVFHACLGFTYLNSVLDPVVYCFSSPTFNRAYKKALASTGLCSISLDYNNSEYD
uniref:Oxoeicosanoid receptor 1 n=2 Tax=Latimeria chalumnae TaxID=7897 RepID=H3AMA0_LATCH